ncbi:13954_t:CDS:2, partial [Dentiscutata erythropus]
DYVPELALKEYTMTQLRHLQCCDSITIDPHKSGYCPYPAGGLCYKDNRMRYLITRTSPIVFRNDESIGVYGIEGSNPGAAPVGVYLSHKVIELNRDGHGILLGEATFSYKTSFIIVPFNILLAELEPDTSSEKVEKQKQFIRNHIVNRPNKDLVKDEEAMNLIKKLGSDLMINAFSCNFCIDGNINEDVVEANYLNQCIFERLSITKPDNEMMDKKLILTSTVFKQEDYGEYLTNFKKCLAGNFFSQLAKDFKQILEQEVKARNIYMNNIVAPDYHGFIIQGIEKIHLVHLPMFNMENHRYQLILQAEILEEIMCEYIRERKKNPMQIFILGNQNKTTLNDIISGKEFLAVIDKGLPPPSGQHWKTDVKVKNIKVIKKCGLQTRYLDDNYPKDHMPFYLYSTENELHIDHLLVKSPNIQLSADWVKFKIQTGFPVKIQWENGVLAYFTDIREVTIQPFPAVNSVDNPEPDFFFQPDRKYKVELYEDKLNLTDISGISPFVQEHFLIFRMTSKDLEIIGPLWEFCVIA